MKLKTITENLFKFILLIMLVLTCKTYSQNNYGISLGTSGTFAENGEDHMVYYHGPKSPGFRISGFYNHQLNNHFGVVGNLTYDHRNVLNVGYSSYMSDVDFVKLNYLSVNPIVKFDVNGSYNRGFYLKGGFSYDIIMNAKVNNSDLKVTESFKNSITSDFGFGVDFKKYIGLETVFSYTLNNTLKDKDVASNLLGINIIMNIYLDQILDFKK